MAKTKFFVVLRDYCCNTHTVITFATSQQMTAKQVFKLFMNRGDSPIKVFTADQEAEAKEWAKTYRPRKMRDVSGKVIQKSWQEIEREK